MVKLLPVFCFEWRCGEKSKQIFINTCA